MEKFWVGVLAGWLSLALIAENYGAGEKKQCELDHAGKKCELLWIPTTMK